MNSFLTFDLNSKYSQNYSNLFSGLKSLGNLGDLPKLPFLRRVGQKNTHCEKRGYQNRIGLTLFRLRFLVPCRHTILLIHLWSNCHQTWHDGTLGQNLSKILKRLMACRFVNDTDVYNFYKYVNTICSAVLYFLVNNIVNNYCKHFPLMSINILYIQSNLNKIMKE